MTINKQLYYHWFNVTSEPPKEFPLRMLSEDSCFPEQWEENYEPLKETAEGPYSMVTLGCFAPEDWEPTHERWEKHGWHVSKHNHDPRPWNQMKFQDRFKFDDDKYRSYWEETELKESAIS